MSAIAKIWRRASAARQQALQVCESALSALERERTSLIEAGDFRIDLDSRVVTVRGRELRLSWAEFDVLVYLTSHTRRIISSSTWLSTKTEDGGLHHAEFIPALLSLRTKLREEAPGSHYLATQAWLLFEFHPGSDQ